MHIRKALTLIPAVLLGLLAVLPPAHADDYSRPTSRSTSRSEFPF